MKISKQIISILLSAGMILSSIGNTGIVLAADTDIATTTDADSTEIEDNVETTEDSDEIIEINSEESMESEESIELITFDHSYSDIDTSVVNTTDLFVQTNDSNVFTYNTTVVSNYDDIYILSFNSVEEAQSAYSYYYDKVDFITDLSNTITLSEEATETDAPEEDVADLSNVNTTSDDAIANLNEITVSDYSGYIALIDSGCNEGSKLSVLGDDGSDTNGHGTKMYQYIKNENPDANIVSIKAFNGSKTNIADVYAAIRLAIDSNVSVINMSFVANNIE